MTELVERDWAMEEIEFWENRAKHYRDMTFDLMAKMMKGVKFNSVEWTADRITWKEKQSGWIPVSERLPQNDDWVIVTILDERGDTPYKYTDFGWYLDVGNCWIVDAEQRADVTAWMPLPEPFKEEE